MGFHVLEHTADTGIEVEAGDLPELFAEAARGFAACITELDTIESRLERRLALTGGDLETLMVDWLGELLYVFEVEGEVFSEVEVELTQQAGAFRLDAVCRGERFEIGRHPLSIPVKAVTYHGLRVEQDDSGRWSARVVFDI